MARREEPAWECRHFRKDGVTQFTEIPYDDPEVVDYLRDVLIEAAERAEKRRRETAPLMRA